MQSVLVFLAVLSVSAAFRMPLSNGKTAVIPSRSLLRMSDEPPKPPKLEESKYEIVPLEKKNIENAAAVTGGVLGFVLGGPVFAAIFAAVSNYVVKKENDSGEALKGVGKTVIESYNFLNKLNFKYGITGKVTESVKKATSSIELENEAFETVKKTYSTVTSKASELNKEYDLIGKGKEVIVAAGTLSDTALEKISELNSKYDFVGSTKGAATKLVDQVKEKANEIEKPATPTTTAASKSEKKSD